MILIVGLGNPGIEYKDTRHNAGYMALDRLADKLKTVFTKENKFSSLIARSDQGKVVLAKPQTYMNLCGQSVLALAKFYKLQPENIWLIYDDVDLPVGMARTRGRGMGKSSHRGIRSVAAALGKPEFSRFRIGIAHADQNIAAAKRPHKPVDLKNFVLQPFDKRERPLVEKAIEWVVNEIITALKTGQVVSRTLTRAT